MPATKTVRLRPATLCPEAQAIVDAAPEGSRRDASYYASQARWGMRGFVEGMVELNRGWVTDVLAGTRGTAEQREIEAACYERRALLAEAELRARDEAAAAGFYVGS